jgi:hypothetical protein
MVITMATKKSKTIVTPGTKVKQDMIDFIKTQGMTRALKRAGEINAKGTKGEAEFIEGVRRMYGARRLAAATQTAMPKAPLKKGSYQAGSAKSGKATYTTGSGVKYKSSGTSSAKPVAKKDNTKSNLLKGVAGTAAAVGLLAVGRGKGAGAISKLSPQMGRAMKSPVGKILFGDPGRDAKFVAKASTKVSNAKLAAKDKVLSTSGRVSAKTTKTVSQSQYDAMKSAAAARGVKPVAKTATKLTTKKKVGLAGAGTGSVSLKGDTAKKKK